MLNEKKNGNRLLTLYSNPLECIKRRKCATGLYSNHPKSLILCSYEMFNCITFKLCCVTGYCWHSIFNAICKCGLSFFACRVAHMAGSTVFLLYFFFAMFWVERQCSAGSYICWICWNACSFTVSPVILNELAITYFNRSCIISLKQPNSNDSYFVVISTI